MQVLTEFDQSRFWVRLEKLSTEATGSDAKEAVDHLKVSVRKVANRAAWINTQVCRYMPQYTLHEERHFLNVLGIMDALVPDDVMQRLTPLECALPILAAYTHDLGMALSQLEHNALLDESTEQGKHFACYRTRFNEELRQLERWRKNREELKTKDHYESKGKAAQTKNRIDAIEGHILSSYLRDTHTEDDQVGRLRHWLEAIKQETCDDNLFCYGNFDYQRTLVLIGISHGRGAPWLRRQLIDGGLDDRFFQPVATGESANLAFPGLLLRLADVMDFDVSRAPRILFKHFGIENDQSVLEWNKHLSIVGWRLDVDPNGKQQPDLLYSAECQHPVHEKAIREFKTWIDAELSAVQIELEAQRRQLPAAAQPRYNLHLPSQTRVDIRSARDPVTDQPKYVYHDLQFRLDQDEIQQLLMGESLYGDPGLCIRELLQNALDALELRELRLKMKQKGEAREPVDGELIRPGWVREPNGREEEFRVTLDWGTDEETGQQWLRVTDNGVGMTEEVIKDYFTQIGKSYYRSPEFNQERAAMKASGEVVSPISIFGIGILSCFMIADRLVVRTRPSDPTHPNEHGFDVTISGSGSLFWLQPGTLQAQGTEITLFLKDFALTHSSKNFTQSLREEFRYPCWSGHRHEVGSKHELDPPLYVASNAVWTLYPVYISTPCGRTICVNENIHRAELAALDQGKLCQIVDAWGYDGRDPIRAEWQTWDWNDSQTGSRIRIWFPCAKTSTTASEDSSVDVHSLLDSFDLMAFATPQLSSNKVLMMVHGMAVPVPRPLEKVFGLLLAIGTMGWVDLRGELAPKLTTDRLRMLVESDTESELHKLFVRMFDALICATESGDASVPNHILIGLGYATFLNSVQQPRSEVRVNELSQHEQIQQQDKTVKFGLVSTCSRAWTGTDRLAVRFVRSVFQQSLALDQARDLDLQLSDAFEDHAKSIDPVGDDAEFEGVIAWGIPKSAKRDCEQEIGTVIALGIGGHVTHKFSSYDEDTDVVDSAYEDRRFAFFDQLSSPFCWFSDPDRPLNYKDHIRERWVSFTEQFMRQFPTFDSFFDSSLLQESFRPDLSKSWAFLRLWRLNGQIADGTLEGPALVSLNVEDDLITTLAFDEDRPAELIRKHYDLTFPMTAVPLGQLRRECGEWRSDRWYRPLGVAPFLLPALHDVWPAHAKFLQETFKVPHIYCLLPRFELWSKRFCDWADADWHDPENLSALWDLSGQVTGIAGQVLWARGTHDINEMPKIGLPAPAFLDAAKK